MSAIEELLQKAHEIIRQPEEFNTIRIVIGNESCDLDSTSCLLALSHFLFKKYPSDSILPLVQCHREDLPLRQDIVWLFKHLNIDLTQLIHFPEEVEISKLPHPQVTLVDHNVPDETLRPHVTEIIDHHDDAQTIRCPRTIEPVGSCATLVGERLLTDKEYEIPEEVATLLLAAILADTANLLGEGRVTEKDKYIASLLVHHVSITTDELYNQISTAKYNISDLSTLQLLRADFKSSQAGDYRLGFCTIRSLITKLVTERDNVEQDLMLFSHQNNLHLLVLLCIQTKPLRRQIALYQPPDLPPDIPQDLVDSVAATLETDSELQVERVGEGMFDGIVLEQGNTSISRKQILPIVTRCLHHDDFDTSGSYLISPDHIPVITHKLTVEEDKDDNLKKELTKEKKNLDDEDIERDKEEYESQRGSLLQLESISARLGESMDSFALAQDSDQAPSPLSSHNSSVFNINDRSGSMGEDKQSTRQEDETRPPPPLEPIIDIISPHEISSPAVLPTQSEVPPIPEYLPDEETQDTRDFRYVLIDGEEKRINLKFIESYRPIIQHGGYLGNEQTAVIIISACYLPPKSLHNYPQMISQTFFYVLSVVDKLVVDDYVIVYLHSGAPRNSMPGIQWFHRFYRMIDRRLRKNLKHLYVVHPSFWVKTMFRLARPFISRKFYRKLHYISSLQLLSTHVSLDQVVIPQVVQSVDQNLNPEDYQTSTS